LGFAGPPEEQEAMKKLFAEIRGQEKSRAFINSWITKGVQTLLMRWTGATLLDRHGRSLYVVVAGEETLSGGRVS
jgi:hypothetical protein